MQWDLGWMRGWMRGREVNTAIAPAAVPEAATTRTFHRPEDEARGDMPLTRYARAAGHRMGKDDTLKGL